MVEREADQKERDREEEGAASVMERETHREQRVRERGGEGGAQLRRTAAPHAATFRGTTML